jgi:hypothetical protein
MAGTLSGDLRAPLSSDAMSLAGAALGTSVPVADDQYFNNELGLVAAFDFGYEEIITFETQLRWAALVLVPPLWATCVCCYPCFLSQNVEWETRAKHVALTVDGIRYVTEKRKAVCGLPCTDRGKESKTVPYDKITDCDVQEPAGTACCCCIPRVLSVVNVDTASSGGGGKDGLPRHELTLKGLRFPNEFKQAVWGMKRGQAPAIEAGALAMAPQQVGMDGAVLLEIRDELRKMNGLLGARG